MIALFILSMLAAPSMGPTADPAEVVVMSRKLETWKGNAHASDKGATCKTSKSSGDADIDAIGCASVVTCMNQMMPRIAAAQERGVGKDQRKALMAAVDKDLLVCLTSERDRQIAALAERRFEARSSR
ncbi:hypothetical protein [Sphingomonas jaspsi]|uniref:hypothetical protein n=1 Tax=Sphingomonas jaspsi TaxID=392409 RepID=UPI0004B6CEB0|nr:hypothetical protein [Sphingomonas jaspsi]